MGRPPIGKVAMTATERSHRFRAKQRVTEPVTEPKSADARLAEFMAANRALAVAYDQLGRRYHEVLASLKDHIGEAAAFKAHIAELEAQVARLNAELAQARAAAPPLFSRPRTAEDLMEIKRRVAEARAARRASPEAKIAAVTAKLEQAQRRIAKLQDDGAVQKENQSLRRQLAKARASARAVISSPKGTVFVTKSDLRKIRACLHPDRARTAAEREQCEAASKAFNTLPIRSVEV